MALIVFLLLGLFEGPIPQPPGCILPYEQPKPKRVIPPPYPQAPNPILKIPDCLMG
jgi:hypothetical protein